MKKFKNMMKKGGIADIVTLMIIVGLVIALIITVILPMITDAEQRRTDNQSQASKIDAAVETKVETGLTNWGVTLPE